MTTTATHPDAAAFLRAIAAEPDNDTPRLAFADWLDEQEPVRVMCPKCYGSGWRHPGANNGPKCPKCGNSSQNAPVHGKDAHRRCASCKTVWRPLGCTRCKGAGSVLDTSNRDRAEFIRVQCRLWREYGEDYSGFTMIGENLRDCVREHALLEAHQRAWLAVGACPKCGGTRSHRKAGSHDYDREEEPCRACFASGDTGGLLREGCEVAWRRGWPHRVTVPALAWLVEEVEERCEKCKGRGFTTGYIADPKKVQAFECDKCKGAPVTTRTVPSRWLRSVLTTDASRSLLCEVVPLDRNANVDGVWFANRDQNYVPNPADANWLPWAIACSLDTSGDGPFAYPGFERWEWSYATPAEATAALGRAFCRFGRGATPSGPRPR